METSWLRLMIQALLIGWTPGGVEAPNQAKATQNMRPTHSEDKVTTVSLPLSPASDNGDAAAEAGTLQMINGCPYLVTGTSDK